MERFTKKIIVGNESRSFEFERMENVNGIKFFITSEDEKKKPIAFSLKQGLEKKWKLTPGSHRWLYDIESQLSDAIVDSSFN